MPELRWERNALGHVLELSHPAQRRIVEQLRLLRRFPELGMPALPPFLGRRRLVVGPYSVIYEYDATADVVSVIAIARGGPIFR